MALSNGQCPSPHIWSGQFIWYRGSDELQGRDHLQAGVKSRTLRNVQIQVYKWVIKKRKPFVFYWYIYGNFLRAIGDEYERVSSFSDSFVCGQYRRITRSSLSWVPPLVRCWFSIIFRNDVLSKKKLPEDRALLHIDTCISENLRVRFGPRAADHRSLRYIM